MEQTELVSPLIDGYGRTFVLYMTMTYSPQLLAINPHAPIPVATRSKAWVTAARLLRLRVRMPPGDMDVYVCLL